VERKLKVDWSPEIIAEKLKIDYPDNDEMRVSHETIYRWIYLDAKGGGILYHHLRLWKAVYTRPSQHFRTPQRC
jgi:IS30 family transposase